jgi:hypothetical protein
MPSKVCLFHGGRGEHSQQKRAGEEEEDKEERKSESQRGASVGIIYSRGGGVI